MTDGVVFIACGPKAEEQYRYAADAMALSGNTYPSQRLGMDYGATNKQASRHAKTKLVDWSYYDRFVYLDADTRARESLKPLFDILADGWDIAITASSNQDYEAFWHVGEDERKATLEQIGVMPLQLQCGVMAVAKNERTKALFDAWNDEWLRYSGEDQAAFIRALYRHPVKIWMLGKPWNGGAAIGHNWGAMR